ncbi:MAG: class I SAM-dependent methyltransferase [Anaerolineae bacterium]|nr:class I SAM-dependent methyltransferase [Anaerolineae bacterium]MDW8173785.1 class I SAM-dependent methyltransferase [Anaerolineae bacterium]
MRWLKRGLRVLPSQSAYALWAQSYPAQAHNPLMALEEAALRAFLPDLRGLDVLDVGCGSGRWLKLAQADGARRALGIDSSAAMLRRAGPGTALATMTALPFPAASFDLLLCALAIGHLPDHQPALAEMARLLRPDGLLLLSDFHSVQHWRGAQRTFRAANGRVYAVEHYPRTVADFWQVGERVGLRLCGLSEPALEVGGPPVVLVLAWQKQA